MGITTYPKIHDLCFFPESALADLSCISVGLGCKLSIAKNLALRIWAICHTVVIFLNTDV